MTLLSLLLVASAQAVVVRAPAASARPAPAALPRAAMGSTLALTPSLGSTALAAADGPSPLAAPAPGLAPDREAALVAKLAAKLPSQDSASRAKTAAWIRDIAIENPRAVVQAAAVEALARDAEVSGNLIHFENLAADIEAVASATPFDSVFEDAVGRLVDAARRSGRAQREHALRMAERIGRSGTPERREKAAALIEGLREDPAFRLDADEVVRSAARVRAGG
ncbi:MAG: hypothetical protein SF051_14535 [Elusimicrobiota bacterium]|nr:hypothetical protein [Elusimicrobiota bacterium]